MDDLDFSRAGTAYYENKASGHLIIQFSDVPYKANSRKRVTCQVAIHEDGEILCQYKRVDIPNQCTVGVQDATRTKGLTVAFNEPYLRPELAVRMRPLGASWLTPETDAGVIAAGGTEQLFFSFTNTAVRYVPFGLGFTPLHRPMRVGTYTAFVAVASSDLDDPQVTLPVIMSIEGNPNNHAPVARDIHLTILEDHATNLNLTALGGGFDEDGDTLYYDIVDPASTGFAWYAGDLISYRPPFNGSGEDSFTFVADDIEAYSATATVFISILPVNDLPVVWITAPFNQEFVDVDEPVTVLIRASDVDSAITNVELLVNGELRVPVSPFSNEYYQASFIPPREGSNTLVVAAYDEHGGATTSSHVRVIHAIPMESPDGPLDTLSGLNVAYYEGEWDSLPDFESLTPKTTSVGHADQSRSPRTRRCLRPSVFRLFAH